MKRVFKANPHVGEAKVGDLQGIRVVKFTFQRQQYLIACRPPSAAEISSAGAQRESLSIDFYQLGTHENFYATLKKYLKSRGT